MMAPKNGCKIMIIDNMHDLKRRLNDFKTDDFILEQFYTIDILGGKFKVVTQKVDHCKKRDIDNYKKDNNFFYQENAAYEALRKIEQILEESKPNHNKTAQPPADFIV